MGIVLVRHEVVLRLLNTMDELNGRLRVYQEPPDIYALVDGLCTVSNTIKKILVEDGDWDVEAVEEN